MLLKKATMVSIVLSLAFTGAVNANCGKCKKKTSEIKHPFLACCFSAGKIAFIDEDGSIIKEYKTGRAQDAWILSNGDILYSHYGGARIINPDGTVVWEYKTKDVEVHSAQPLANGNVLIAESGAGRIVEVDKDGKIAKEIKIDTKVKGRHHEFRTARKGPKGTYFVACLGDGVFREYDGDGKLLREFFPGDKPLKNGAHAVVPMPNGHILASTGYGKSFVEFDKDGKVCWSLSQEDLPEDFKLGYTCSAQRLPNGNTVISTYHGKPQFFEVTPDKKVVWSYHNEKLGNVSGILLLDVKGDPAKGEIIR